MVLLLTDRRIGQSLVSMTQFEATDIQHEATF
jgi:hypothetical protein